MEVCRPPRHNLESAYQGYDDPDPVLRPAGRPATIGFPPQPEPARTSLIVTPDGAWSSLVREWRPGEVESCRLCPAGTCIADGPRCHLLVEGTVRPEEAPLWSSRRFARSVGRPPRD